MQPIVTVPPSSLHQVTIGATLRISQREKIIHVLFDISILGKGIDGALEIVGGMLLFFVNPAQINHLVRTLTQ
jgi:uncharacterized membrane protein